MAAGALLLWTAAGFAVEAARFAAAPAAPRSGSVADLRLGMPGARGLELFCDQVAPRLGPGDVVAFTGGSTNPLQEDFFALWGAYLLPRQRVLALRDPRAPQLAEWVAAFDTRLDLPRLEEVERFPGGVLYRVRPAPR